MRWAERRDRVRSHRREGREELGVSITALVTARDRGAECEGESTVEGEDASRRGLATEVLLTEVTPHGLAQVAKFLAERARVESVAGLVGAVERGDHGELA